jgi:hypothetical protein
MIAASTAAASAAVLGITNRLAKTTSSPPV